MTSCGAGIRSPQINQQNAAARGERDAVRPGAQAAQVGKSLHGIAGKPASASTSFAWISVAAASTGTDD
jgi:hypothetical protein